jgi:PhoH-like ATPase
MEALSYIRGRSFVKRILLIDEAQNLSKHQVRTIVTRAGEGTKVIMLGNLAQIDSPYVSITTSGLTHAVQSFNACEFAGHVTLEKGERSKLASYAAKTL